MTSDLVQALEDVQEARIRYRKCVDECSTSPGYYCHRELTAYREAEERFAAAFEAAVDARIKAATSPAIFPPTD